MRTRMVSAVLVNWTNNRILPCRSRHSHNLSPFNGGRPFSFMSSSGQATTRTSHSNFQSIIIHALADYADQTGVDLSQNPFAEKLRQAKTSDDILELLQEREKAFEEYRNGDRGLVNCLSPAVRVLHGFSDLLGQTIGIVSPICIIPLGPFHIGVLIQTYQVPYPPTSAVFVGIDVLLTVCGF